ncbi:hypothetical protein [uncultured Litoreibacter sp.]|uniref:hypothetical protein n=1 Tax=uncultured Litoreibacter sp. TaxID=1392394 RepID=UPI00260B23FE|nr:hypothetical protein [uncultured Litoreibacter sp.]
MPDTTSPLSPRGILMLMLAGALATTAFDIYGQVISPALGGSRLAPVPLAGSVWRAIAGFPSKEMAELLHYTAGVIGYPLGFALVARPLWQKIAPAVPWWAVAVAFGCAQWVFALYIMAHLVAGQPAFLDWTGITWAALWGHIVYALVAIGVSNHFALVRR